VIESVAPPVLRPLERREDLGAARAVEHRGGAAVGNARGGKTLDGHGWAWTDEAGGMKWGRIARGLSKG
jgi:hypothetical protein